MKLTALKQKVFAADLLIQIELENAEKGSLVANVTIGFPLSCLFK